MRLEIHISGAGVKPCGIGKMHVLQTAGTAAVGALDIIVFHIHAVGIQMDAYIIPSQIHNKILNLAHGIEEIADKAEDVLDPDPDVLIFGIVRQLRHSVPVIA